MKRKITLVLLAILTLLCVALLSSCTDAKIENAVERTEDLDSYEATLVLTLTKGTAAAKTTVEIEVKDPLIGKEKEHFKIIQEGKSTELFKEENWIYVPNGGYKISERSYLNEGVDFAKYKELLEEVASELPDELVRDAKVEKIDDSEYYLSAKLTNEEIRDDYKDAIAIIKSLYGLENAAVESATIDVMVDERYANQFTLSVSFKVGEESYIVNVSVEYDDPGDSVEIDFPKGYKDYKEVSSLR